jgi:signal peptidase II
MILWIILSIGIILIDQFTKLWVVGNIGPQDTITIMPRILDFVYVENKGAAFSFLANKTYGTIILSVISVLFCVGVIFYMVKFKPQNKLLLCAVSMMLGGAIGNVIDRIIRGFVVDFIEVKFISFPVFNVADIAITVGAGLLILYVLLFENDKKQEER